MSKTTVKRHPLIGQEVEVFEDPFTCKKLEGRAVIKRVMRENKMNKSLTWMDCRVRFVVDVDGPDCYRTIAYHGEAQNVAKD